MTNNESKNINEVKETICFLTEQACLNIWIMGWDATNENFKDFKTVVMHLAKDDLTLQGRFTEYTNKVINDEGGTKEYDAQRYGGETKDVPQAVVNLTNIAKDPAPDMPEQVRDALNRLAGFITDFHAAGEPALTTGEIEKAIYFLAEQACCLSQAHDKVTKDYNICEKAVRFLAKGDPKLLKPFKERTQTIKYDPDADYDTEQYEGKDADIRATVANLIKLAEGPGTPADKRELLSHGARMIAEFYGLDDALPETA